MRENRFNMTNLALYAYKNTQFQSFNIVGRKGAGKTTMAMKTMCQTFMALGHDEDKAYQLALDNLLFAKSDIINYLHKHSGKQQPIVCFDDVRSNLSAMSYISFPLQTQLLQSLCDVARDSVACIITTCPSTKGLLSFLRREQGYHVLVHRHKDKDWRRCKGYLKFEIPSGTMRIKPKFIDDFHYKLPDDIYEKVCEKRKRYKDILVKSIEDRIENLNSRNKNTTVLEKEKQRVELNATS